MILESIIVAIDFLLLAIVLKPVVEHLGDSLGRRACHRTREEYRHSTSADYYEH